MSGKRTRSDFYRNYSGSQIIDITCNFLIILTVNPKVPPDCFAPAVQDFRADAEAEFMVSLAKLSGLSRAKKDHLIHLSLEHHRGTASRGERSARTGPSS
jgi:hypothetical protein